MPVAEQNVWRRFGLKYHIINPLRRADYHAAIVAHAMEGGGDFESRLLEFTKVRRNTAVETNDTIATALSAMAASGTVSISEKVKYVQVK